MEIPKTSWHTYTSRKRLDVKAWCERHGIASYKDLVAKCEALKVEPPKKTEVSSLFSSKSKLQKSADSSTSAPSENSSAQTKAPKTKRRTRKKKEETSQQDQ